MRRVAGSFGRFWTLFFGVGIALLAEGTFGGSSYVVATAQTTEAARNESIVIDFCADYVDAQMKYFRTSRNPDGVLVFAQRIRSTPGRLDGLYWPIENDDDESPVGPNVAAAAITEQAPGEQPRPFAGYYFKTLLAQGPGAPGGERDYRVNGRLLTGFALLAWPAEYGVSGVHSFLVNHLGDVYARDLGVDTGRLAINWSTFDPNPKWKRVLMSNKESKE